MFKKLFATILLSSSLPLVAEFVLPPEDHLKSEPLANFSGYWQNTENEKDVIRIDLGQTMGTELMGLDLSEATALPTSFWDLQDLIALRGSGFKANGSTVVQKGKGNNKQRIEIKVDLELSPNGILNLSMSWQGGVEPGTSSAIYRWRSPRSDAQLHYLNAQRMRARALLRLRFDTLIKDAETVCKPELTLSHFVKKNDLRCVRHLAKQGVKAADILQAVKSLDYNLLKFLLSNFDVSTLSADEQNLIMDEITVRGEENVQKFLTTDEKHPRYVLAYLDENAIVNLLLDKGFKFASLPDDKLQATPMNWNPPWVIEEMLTNMDLSELQYEGQAQDAQAMDAYLRKANDPNGILAKFEISSKRVIPEPQGIKGESDTDWVLAWAVRRAGLDGNVLLQKVMEGKGLASPPRISDEALILFAGYYRRWEPHGIGLKTMEAFLAAGADVDAAVVWDGKVQDLATTACLFGDLSLVKMLYAHKVDFSKAILKLHQHWLSRDPMQAQEFMPVGWAMLSERFKVSEEQKRILDWLQANISRH